MHTELGNLPSFSFSNIFLGYEYVDRKMNRLYINVTLMDLTLLKIKMRNGENNAPTTEAR